MAPHADQTLVMETLSIILIADRVTGEQRSSPARADNSMNRQAKAVFMSVFSVLKIQLFKLHLFKKKQLLFTFALLSFCGVKDKMFRNKNLVF